MKSIIITFSIIAALAVASCNTNTSHDTSSATTDTNKVAQAEGTQYVCPMHAEVISDKPGKCPKCGMDLVVKDETASIKKYKMNFNYEPAKLEAGKAATFHFMPVVEGNNDVTVPLDVVHEKKIHLIIVSKDLSYFEHIHPQAAADGHYLINVLPSSQAYTNGIGNNETKFQYGGEYVLFADYMPTGGEHQLERIPFSVDGKEKSAVKYTKENLSWSKNGYKVELSFDKEKLTTNESIGLKTTITKDGKPVTDLDHYLGALGHMVVISEDTEKYLHVHPMDSELHGPDILFHSSFDSVGIYRVFLQFKHKDQLQTVDFVISVNEIGSKPSQPDSHDNH